MPEISHGRTVLRVPFIAVWKPSQSLRRNPLSPPVAENRMKAADESLVYPVGKNECFRFYCGPGVSCFNACCRDLNQYLSPYDVLRLTKRLEMSSSAFLETAALRHEGPQSGLPVITLKPQAFPELKCPFVTPQGCGVYEDRPASCRMYPVMRMAGRDPASGSVRESFMLLRESHCLGFEASRRLTVNEWMEEQGLFSYNEANDAFLPVLGAKRRNYPGILPKKLSDGIFTALYDADRFISEHQGVFHQGVLQRTGAAPKVMDEMAYLRVVFECVIRSLETGELPGS